MSYHQVEDIIEDAINMLDRADLVSNKKRDLIYNLYRFQDRFDTSFTRFRVLSALEDCHYAYQLPIDKHPSYVSHKSLFNTYSIDAGDWIPVDFSETGHSVYIQGKRLFFEAGDVFWEIIKKQLPKADQESPEQMALPLVFYTLLQLAEQQKEKLFIKRWYATFVNSILEYELDDTDAIPKAFRGWLLNDTLLKIRDFVQIHQKAIYLKDKTYKNDALLALPNLKDETEFVTQADEIAKLRFLVDLKSSLNDIETRYNKEISYQPDFSKLELIYTFFREKLDNEWQDGIKEIDETEGLVTFLTASAGGDKNSETHYRCLIVEYDLEFKMLSFNIGIQNERILKWQDRKASSSPYVQHFAESLLRFIPNKELDTNPHFAKWGGWKYDIKQTKNSLLKRLETLWKHYEKYSPKIYEFHFLSVVEWAGVNDSNALMKRRKKVLNKGYNFFANEMDFKIFLACLNHKQGHIELANQYVDETQKLLDEGRASPQLKKRIKQGLTYVQKNTKNYPEITTIYSNRLKRK